MESFLTEIAQTLVAEHPDDLDQVMVVFNNRRSGLFLRRQFSVMGEKPFFLPKIVGIDDLISELGNLEIVPNEFLLFELFDIHRSLGGEGRKFETFEEFISFGDMMLADFSEIDLYQVDAQQLFSNLHELKAIGEWDVETGQLTPFQQKYIEFYKSLYQYYSQLHQRLAEQHKAYSGMAYRYVAENIEQLAPKLQSSQIYFVGFNALSSSEHTIIRHFIKEGIGKLLTDGDSYYVEDSEQEAGHFLRKYQGSDIPIPEKYPSHFASNHKNITIVSCPENVLQCKYTGKLISSQFKDESAQSLEQTAVVLGDESLLLPTLNALPKQIRTANVTMGYPFVNTAVYSLMLKLFSLHQRRHQEYFHHQDILDILSDHYISKVLGINNIYTTLSQLLYRNHIIYANQEEIVALCREMGCEATPLLPIFSIDTPSPDQFLAQCTTLIHTLYTSEVFESNRREKEALACLLQIINYFQNLQQRYHFVKNLNVLLKIYTRLAKRRSVAFYGEPLQGLQILGVLETRNLDFKKVILLSANEGTLPSGRTNNTLIPYNLKRAFGIPTFHEKDAVYAYNFYRLLQRAGDIYLLYHTESDGMGKGSPSRFILQVRRELAEHYPNNITIHEEVLSAENATNIESTILSYPKDSFAMSRLQDISKKGFSPSALNKYRNCPLKFYFENVLGINEMDQVNEDLEQNELGTHIHAILQTIYTETKGQVLQKETLQQALLNLDRLLEEEFAKDFQHGRSHKGKNHFLESVAKTQITNFLQNEIKHLSKGDNLTILELEKPLSHTLKIESADAITPVTISGIADRIDQWNGTTRVLDYKSGKVEEKDLKVKADLPNWSEVPDKWFQVMLYTWLFSYNKSNDAQHLAGIIPLSHLDSKVLLAEWEGSNYMTEKHLTLFETILREIVSDILNPDIPFIANPNSKMCQYCPFAETCKLDASSLQISSTEE